MILFAIIQKLLSKLSFEYHLLVPLVLSAANYNTSPLFRQGNNKAIYTFFMLNKSSVFNLHSPTDI